MKVLVIQIKLLVSWLVLTVASIGFVAWKNWISSIVTTSDRKYFHFIILLVFVPGVLVDYGVVFIASVAATCAFILLEARNISWSSPAIFEWNCNACNRLV